MKPFRFLLRHPGKRWTPYILATTVASSLGLFVPATYLIGLELRAYIALGIALLSLLGARLVFTNHYAPVAEVAYLLAFLFSFATSTWHLMITVFVGQAFP